MSDIRHQVTQDLNKDTVVISAFTTPDARVLVETEVLPFHELASLDRDAYEQRVIAAARMNAERIKQRI
ncbi:hypothetical protein HOR67_gp23 [Ralstonia phage RS-PI-1]|uniref:Uncharacterized protein n=1 Tax=Ralstonia phage RS-PI-1 TaxID=1958965 RepID=A0A1S6L1B8_9CAUD|nr:hypothetical protein HOR67_gp23 [Ralstonia phage RS-PI-1]AQT27785.1 hypothetical protein [Ralstonia phage RS-PI-1]